MKVLIQRVNRAQVTVDGRTVASIDVGALAFAAVEKNDDEDTVARIAIRILNWALFADDRDRIALSLQDTGGGLLLVPQFTLAASGAKGLKPDFSAAAPPEQAQRLYQQLLAELERQSGRPCASGIFGAHMRVDSCNDGPVIFLLEESGSD